MLTSARVIVGILCIVSQMTAADKPFIVIASPIPLCISIEILVCIRAIRENQLIAHPYCI